VSLFSCCVGFVGAIRARRPTRYARRKVDPPVVVLFAILKTLSLRKPKVANRSKTKLSKLLTFRSPDGTVISPKLFERHRSLASMQTISCGGASNDAAERPARVLLTVIDRDPEAVLKALRIGAKPGPRRTKRARGAAGG
jgi:hypothetical protein